MSDPQIKDSGNPDYYINTEHIEPIDDDDDIKPPIDVTPPLDQSPNISGAGDAPPELLPEPDKPEKKKGLFGKKEKKEKPPKQKKEKKAGDEGSTSKLKGLFKKNKKEDTTAIQIDNFDGGQIENDPNTQQSSLPMTPTQPGTYPGYPGMPQSQVPSYPSAPTAPYTTPYGSKPKSSYIRRAPPNYHKEGCAEVKEPPKKSIFRCSNFIVVLLIVACIAGIVMTAVAGDNTALSVIGPFFIGVPLFALVGKIFFTLFWTKEAHPMLKPASKAINTKMRTGPNYQQQQYATNTYNYPRSSAYNAAYDMPLQGPPDALNAPGEYLSEDDYAPYSQAGNYHEEPMPDDYGYGTDGQYQTDIKEEDDMRKDFDEVDIQHGLDEGDTKKDYDQGGDPRFL